MASWVVDLQELGSDGGNGDGAEHTAGVGQGITDHRVGGQLWVGTFQHVHDGRHAGGGCQRGGKRTGGRGGLDAEERHQ